MNAAFTAESAMFGHFSPETAHLVEDYPYGFTLRTSIRYWIETVPKKGDRFCSQTRNPKVAGEVWNKPKKSTYVDVGVMYRDEQGHVTWTGINAYASAEDLAAFTAVVGDNLNPIQAQMLRIITKVQAIAATRAQAINAQVAAREAGAQAHAAGAERIVPRDTLVDQGVKVAEAWYRGWDAANLAAAVTP